MKHSVILLYLLVTIIACQQDSNQSTSDFKIDERVIDEVNSKISKSEFGGPFDNLFLIYDNTLLADMYVNDSLIGSTRNKERKMPFKSFFYARNDTISIDGAYGLFGGFGFSIKLVDNTPTVYHMLAGDEFPEYSETKTGDLKLRIEVPCSDVKLRLSKYPKLKENDIIYGIVEFKSDAYYQGSGLVNDEEVGERVKTQTQMKIYFKSRFIDIDKL